MQKQRKWLTPLFEVDECVPSKKLKNKTENVLDLANKNGSSCTKEKIDNGGYINTNSKIWMKNFDPVNVDDLAVHNKKIQEVEEWLKNACISSNNALLLTGPVGCGKTATIQTLAKKHNIKVTEWITPLDIEYPSEYGDFGYKESQPKRFMEFIISSANFTSLLDNNNCKLVLVEDFPNSFLRSPSEFTEVIQQYKRRALSPIVFICSESYGDNKNTALSLFTPSLKEQFKIHHISFNSISITGLKSGLKRAADIISKKYINTYNTPTAEVIESVVNTSAGDIRSAILNLHFACLKGSNCNLETSFIKEKESKSKTTRKKKNVPSKFLSLGKDPIVSILHGVGRVLNPKESISGNGEKTLVHSPREITEQFVDQSASFVNFMEENYLSHFSCIYDAEKAASAMSDADYLIAEWRERICQEYGLYVAIAGVMLMNKSPVSAWNPVRGPKNMKVQSPPQSELSLLDPINLYKRRVLVSDYLSYCKIIGNKEKENDEEVYIE